MTGQAIGWLMRAENTTCLASYSDEAYYTSTKRSSTAIPDSTRRGYGIAMLQRDPCSSHVIALGLTLYLGGTPEPTAGDPKLSR
jgi:hypothetical protein